MALRIAEQGRTALLVELPRPIGGHSIAKVRTRRARVNNPVQRRVNELDPQGERFALAQNKLLPAAKATHTALKTYPQAVREVARERRHKERKEAERAAERAAVARAERNARRNAKKRAARKRLAADRAVISLYN